MNLVIAGIALLTLVSISPGDAAEPNLVGMVRLTGTPPGSASGDGVLRKDYVVSVEGGLAGVFVYVKSGTGVDGVRFEPPKVKPVLQRRSTGFEPHDLGVMAGQTFTVKNADASLDNVNLQGRANGARNIGLPTAGHTSDVVFKTPELGIRVRTEIHPGQTANVGVFSNPFFAVTDGSGRFAISGLPPGRYQLVVYHPKSHGANEGIVTEIEITGGQVTPKDFTIPVPAK